MAEGSILGRGVGFIRLRSCELVGIEGLHSGRLVFFSGNVGWVQGWIP
jgi:hypothetical protein